MAEALLIKYWEAPMSPESILEYCEIANALTDERSSPTIRGPGQGRTTRKLTHSRLPDAFCIARPKEWRPFR
jgi:hypothetical protein